MTTQSRAPRLDTAAVREWIASGDGPRILDVRTPAEFENIHIPGAYNVPLHLLREHRHELREHLDEVVLVCRSGHRAGQAERALAEIGMPNVHVLDGGMLAWESAGGQVRRGRPRWDIERQVRLVAGTLVVVGVVGSLVLPGLQWLSAAMGAGLAGAALTNTCMMGNLLGRLPFNRTASCDIEATVRQLATDGAAGRAAPGGQ